MNNNTTIFPKPIRWTLSWTFYWLGHTTSYFMLKDTTCERLYNIYNRLMVFSWKLQGDNRGKWWVWRK